MPNFKLKFPFCVQASLELPLSLILPLSDLIIDYSFLYPNYEHVLMNIQTTHVLRLLIDYYHSQTTYRLQLLSNYLQTTPILKLT